MKRIIYFQEHSLCDRTAMISFFKRKGMMRLVYSRTNTYQLLLIRPNTLESVPIELIGTYTLIVKRKQMVFIQKETLELFEIFISSFLKFTIISEK